ncbi:DUF2530 domain-containing protein [Streptomyces sp. DSM 42041]|uniref:DUF2530 domain-containing protein n=1 Tax=Streptomyces hazeniae TaxID=3075538 RepID=A0ABU2NNW2_9ACTN|nr:DUF2530 domain-containing protein [Streptomyces sp. DSM 42041]MDT0378460.1 DUF2530 domain-containing protein [Streptomyces sp. DSM 42041]
MGLISKWTDGEREAPEPLEGPVVGTVVTGTLVWFLLFVGQLPFYGWFSDHGHTWWIWTCAAGAGLGLVGLLYVRLREAALRREAAAARDAGRTAGPSAGDASPSAPDPAGGSGRRAPAE